MKKLSGRTLDTKILKAAPDRDANGIQRAYLVSFAPPSRTAAFAAWLRAEGWESITERECGSAEVTIPTLFFATDIVSTPVSALAMDGQALLVIDGAQATSISHSFTWPTEGAAIVDWLICTCRATVREATARALTAFARTQLIGASPAFNAMMDRLCKSAAAVAPVLLTGPTGTGKELLARAIHYCGERAGQGFAAVNCGALPESVLESELFGHRRGAFTDAHQDRAGLVAEADRGTLFLDEVDALTPRAQVALLRFLQSGEYRPVGACKIARADARIVAASNADLAPLMRAGRFLEDLYYRLAVITIEAPRLIDRGDDVVLIAQHFLSHAAERHGMPIRGFTPRALAAMRAYDWPGNIRELENYVHRACVLADGAQIDLILGEEAHALSKVEDSICDAELARTSAGSVTAGFHAAKAATIAAFEREYLAAILAAASGNVTRAAMIAGLERRTFGRLAKRHGLRG